ncbi:helix-turn-helix transcriptional regulator [Lysinibacillus sphaericus]|uniref:helix-turn-helix transcriptional regulator n=1 Tax=Lysinibacillus sphaericus TaxID=1421 RepID=UPI0037F5B2B8
MGKQGQKFYDQEEVYEMINQYLRMKIALGMETETVHGHVGGLISKYDSLGMPKAIGGTSDPTYNAAFRGTGILPPSMAREYMEHIQFIDDCASRITKLREKSILHWRLSGLKSKNIAELEGITDRHVRRILNDIAQKMSEMSVMSEMSKVS